MSYVGSTHDFKDLRAYDIEGETVHISGRYSVEEYLPEEPAAYVNSPCFVLVPEGVDDSEAEVLAVTVDADDLEMAIEPEEAKRRIEQEARWAEESAEEDRRIAEAEA